MRRLRSEDGLAPLELALTVCTWLFPVAILVVSLPTWIERQSLGRLAAQEAARQVVLAGSWDAGIAAGSAMVDQLAANHDVPADDLSVAFSGSMARGDTVIASVTVQIPALTIPFITEVGDFAVTSAHAEAVDQYRSFP